MVITIVTLLLALFSPTITAAREVARQSVCLNKEHQISSAFIGYVNDYKGIYPYADPSKTDTWPQVFGTNNNQICWMTAICGTPTVPGYLGAYASASATLWCPDCSWPAYWSGNQQVTPPTSYGMNGRYFPGNFDSTFTDTRVRADKIPDPASLLFMGEMVNGTNLPFSSTDWLGGESITSTLFNNNYVNSTSPLYWVTDEIGVISGSSNTIRVNHAAGWNSLFVDGHAKRHSKNELRAMTNTPTKSDNSKFWAD